MKRALPETREEGMVPLLRDIRDELRQIRQLTEEQRDLCRSLREEQRDWHRHRDVRQDAQASGRFGGVAVGPYSRDARHGARAGMARIARDIIPRPVRGSSTVPLVRPMVQAPANHASSKSSPATRAGGSITVPLVKAMVQAPANHASSSTIRAGGSQVAIPPPVDQLVEGSELMLSDSPPDWS